MKLLIKQRVFSWTDTYDIYDEDGNVRYFVKGDFFSIGHRLRVFDSSQNEIGLIQEKLLHLLPTFEVYVGGQFYGKFPENTFYGQIHSGLQWMGSRGQYDGMGVRCLCWRGSGHAYIERDFPLGRHLCDRYC